MAAVGAARSGRMTAVPRRAEEVVAAAVGMTAQGKAANRLYGLQFLNFIAVMIFFRIRIVIVVIQIHTLALGLGVYKICKTTLLKRSN